MALEIPTVLMIGTSQSAAKHVCLREACYNFYDVTLHHACMSDTAGAIRLQNNSFTRDSGPAGRLEVFVSTTAAFPWVSICAPDGIDQSAADVACRQLGYERAYDYGGAVSLG